MTALTLSRNLAARLPRIGPAWWLSLAVLLGLSVTMPDQAVASVRFVLDAFAHTGPFLLVAVALAAAAKASGADSLIARAFSGREVRMVAAAALVGALSPFCSCGVIPLIAALLAMGVPLAPVMAFWLASPLMDPSMFLVTASVLGVEFALAKTVAAIGVGLLGGYLTMAVARAGLLPTPLRDGVGDGGCGGAKVRTKKDVVWRFWEETPRRAAFLKEARSVTIFLGGWLTFAFLLESLMTAFVPTEAIASLLGEGSTFAIPLAVVVGVPAYLNGYAALGLVSALGQAGMTAGAGMAFLIAGGVTSIPAAIAVFALARPPVFALYVASAAVGAMLAGLIFGLVA